MACNDFRELISASLDGETTDVERNTLGSHLSGCASCRDYEATASALHRQFRIAAVPAVPDLTAPILAAMATPAPTFRTDLLRALTAGLGVTKIATALGLFIAAFGSTGVHSGTELAAVDLAIGVGFLLAAWKPERATGLVPVLAVLAIATLVGGAADVAAGRVAASTEAFHLLDGVGAVLVWRLSAPYARAKRTHAVTA